MKAPLHHIAHARAGDKGDTSNISVIAYHPDAWTSIREQVTEAAVLQVFAPLGATSVRRYELPNLCALNFVIENCLGGGVNSTLALDRHGKTLSSLLLGAIVIEVEDHILRSCAP